MGTHRRGGFGMVIVLVLATASGCAFLGESSAEDVHIYNAENETVNYDLRIVNNDSGTTVLEDSEELEVSNSTDYRDPMKKGEDYVISVTTSEGVTRQYTWSEEANSYTLSIEFRNGEIVFSTSAA
jgi:outer membrane lipoprotein-sorting protein